MSTKIWKRYLTGSVVALGIAACALTAVAQISPLTDAEKSGMGGGPAPNGAAKSKSTVKPNNDPRDFRGTYSAMGGGGPGDNGPGGVPRGGAAGGPPGGGAPGGGMGGPPGGSDGGGPPEYPQTAFCIPSFSAIGWVEGGVAIMQTKNEITLAAEERHYVRHIYLTDKHSANAKPSYIGNSIGHWEGNTLVIETTMLKDNGVVTERMTKDKDGNIVDEVKQEGGTPGIPSAAGTFKLYWQPNNDPLEWICEDFSDNYMKQAREAAKKTGTR